MEITRPTTSKANALPSKVLCVLIVLSLLGPVVPVLARQPISVAGGTPAAHSGSQLAEQHGASHLTQTAAPVTAAARTAPESWLITGIS